MTRVWVRVGVLSRPTNFGRGDWLWEVDAPATAGGTQIAVSEFFGLARAEDVEAEFTQDPVQAATFTARGLTHGGAHRFVYRWAMTGLRVEVGL